MSFILLDFQQGGIKEIDLKKILFCLEIKEKQIHYLGIVDYILTKIIDSKTQYQGKF